MNVSQFKLYSFGRAAKNLDLDSKTLEVFPSEQSGFADGEINSDREEHEYDGLDMEGNPYSVKVGSSNSISAEWLPFGSNRLIPPDIRRGERVFLWKVGDADRYYWTPSGLDDYLRRRETVIFAISNTMDESVKELTPDNCYYMEWSTHSKQVTLHTSIEQGADNPEPFAFTLQLNTAYGSVTVTDNAGSLIEMDCPQSKITLENKFGSKMGVDKKNGFINVPETMDVKCKNYRVHASSSYTVKSKTYSVNADSSFKGNLTSNGKNISDSHFHNNSSGPGPGGTVA